MNYKKEVIKQLAETILIGDHSLLGIQDSISKCIGLPPVAVQALAAEIDEYIIVDAYPQNARHYLVSWLDDSAIFASLYLQYQIKIRQWPLRNFQLPAVDNKSLIKQWSLPTFDSIEAFSSWCQIDPFDLNWFTKRFRHTGFYNEKIDHYHYRYLKKSNGSLRLLESPKARTKIIQQKINREILKKIPLHEAAHGFVTKRSIKSFAAPHVARPVVIAMDLKDFFLSISSGRLYALFKTLGYSNEVSNLLKGVCTHRTPMKYLDCIDPCEGKRRYQQEHLPQGATTSPALANLAAFNLDARLSGAARLFGFDYTRYADDLVFSSDYLDKGKVSSLMGLISRIVRYEGFEINRTKSRVMTSARRQKIAGVVVNEKVSLDRHMIKNFEAELFNCVRLGPSSQNKRDHPHYREHLEGKLSHIIDVAPHKTRKLIALFDQIEWNS